MHQSRYTMHKRRIVVITGTRAEYGLLYGTMRELQRLPVDLHLIVTGAHLSPSHGMTVKQIEADGFPISAKVDIELQHDRPVDITRSMGIGLAGIGEALDKIKPDLTVILGDRYEMLAAAAACAMLNIPIAHICGGEITEGAIDDLLRHAITKLSYWHFAEAEAYAKRIVQLGEEPSRVFTVGAPGIDSIVKLPLLSRETLEKELGVALVSPVILFTYHPETLSTVSADEQIRCVIEALDSFPEATLLITGANADTGGQRINQEMQAFAQKRARTVFRLSFGSLLYLSAMREADVVVGNSSSAVIEAPVMGKATVNIGNRQTGRLRSPSIIDCDCNTQEIIKGIRLALSSEFQKSLKPSALFGIPGTVAPKIAELLATLPLPTSLRKPFYDLA